MGRSRTQVPSESGTIQVGDRKDGDTRTDRQRTNCFQGGEVMAEECFFPSYKFLHNFPEFLKQVLWRYIPDTPHVQYWYAESEHYILKFPNGTYGFVMARSPIEAYENFVRENSK